MNIRLLLLVLLALSLAACLPSRSGRGGGDDDDDASPADDDDISDDDDGSGCGPEEVEDCLGGCTLAKWIGDSICDESLNCEEFDFDGGDCAGDDDDAADDDDAGDDDDSIPTDGATATGTIACDGLTTGDVYVFTPSGDFTVTVDTVSAATTFDPQAYATLDTSTYASDGTGSGDDEVTCTFPPPTYACPQFDVTGVSGAVAVVVRAYTGDCNSTGTGEYQLIVSGPGAPASLSLTEDGYTL